MLTAIALAVLLAQPSPPVQQLPGLEIVRPVWAFEPMPWLPEEPVFPFGAAFADFIDDVRAESLMSKVTPFAVDDSAQPFELGESPTGHRRDPRLVESHPEKW